jgi:hypothetical protein
MQPKLDLPFCAKGCVPAMIGGVATLLMVLYSLQRVCRLLLSDVRALLLLDAPALLSSLESRKEWLQYIVDSGWTVAGKRGRTAAAAARAGDILTHWCEGDPISDWQQQREAEAAERVRQQEEEQAALGLEGFNMGLWWQGPGYNGIQAAGAFGMKGCMQVKIL